MAGHKGVKLARFDLLPFDALWAVARVFGIGARKYAERNWERGLKYTQVAGARDRHNALYAAGQERDEESGELHLAHAAWHAIVLLALHLRGKLEDDRGGEYFALDTMEAEAGQFYQGLPATAKQSIGPPWPQNSPSRLAEYERPGVEIEDGGFQLG